MIRLARNGGVAGHVSASGDEDSVARPPCAARSIAGDELVQ